MFIRAERSGDWNLHLIALSKMLNVFVATGHNHYAKSARLYLQMMSDLSSSHPWLYDQFVQHGFHTVRRSDRFWAGLWTDLVIEQTLMKALKSRGGLTHGSGMTESVRLTWLQSMHKCASLHLTMSQLTSTETVTEHNHAENGKSRMKRDGDDLKKLLTWFDVHDPFMQSDDQLRCLSSGLTSSLGDGINCDSVEEIGASIQEKMDHKVFLDVVLKKKDQVKTLERLQKGFLVDKKEVFMDSTRLFSRLIVLVERTSEMEPFFSYELTPLPTSLFKDSFMRKPDKAALGKVLYANAICTVPAPTSVFVLDGGSLLHRVKWPKTGLYIDVVQLYIQYVKNNYGSHVTIIFDGYGNGPSTKDHEHDRRTKTGTACAPIIKVMESNPIYSQQSLFLANDKNKCDFIKLLSEHLTRNGQTVIQAISDADSDIVKSGLDEAASGKIVTVVADDTDILVLLVHHFQPTMQDVYNYAI